MSILRTAVSTGRASVWLIAREESVRRGESKDATRSISWEIGGIFFWATFRVSWRNKNFGRDKSNTSVAAGRRARPAPSRLS